MFGFFMGYLCYCGVIAYFSQDLLPYPGDHLSVVPVRDLQHLNPKTLA